MLWDSKGSQVSAGDTSVPKEVACLKNRGISTHHKEEVPGLGHAKLAWEDGLHVPGHQAIEHRVQQQHSQHLSKAEIVVHVDRVQEVSPLDASAWRMRQESSPELFRLDERGKTLKPLMARVFMLVCIPALCCHCEEVSGTFFLGFVTNLLT